VDHDEDGVSLDPICGEPVLEADAPTLEHGLRRYFFCSEGCRARFERRVERLRQGELARMGSLFAGGERVRWGIA
jgi:YHS domain-containing protein